MKSANPLNDWRIVVVILIGIGMIVLACCLKYDEHDEYWRLTYEDSIQVKITRIKVKDNMTHVTMKSKEAKYKTVCFCKPPYKAGDTITIKKP